MAVVAYHASHEQFSPSHLLQLVQQAEEAGFQAIHSSDHFHPWSKRQGNSGYAFSWIGAAMQATQLPFSMVCAPGQRYHPAIVAQAIATIAEMFPERFSIELGSGEALNEVITGTGWPEKQVRNERLKECYDIIKRLLSGEEVNHNGHVQVKNARLYSLPKSIPPLFGAAISEETAQWLGSWAEGMITTAGTPEDVQQKMDKFHLDAPHRKPVYIKFSFSYHPDKNKALYGVHDQWRTLFLGREELADLRTVAEFDRATEQVTLEDMREKAELFTSMQQLKEAIDRYAELGVDRIVLHNLNRDQDRFLADIARSGMLK